MLPAAVQQVRGLTRSRGAWRRLVALLCLGAVALPPVLAPTSSFAAPPPPRLMPKYKIVGDPVIDPSVVA